MDRTILVQLGDEMNKMYIDKTCFPLQPNSVGASAPVMASPSNSAMSQAPSQPNMPIPETLDRVKDEFSYLKAQIQR